MRSTSLMAAAVSIGLAALGYGGDDTVRPQRRRAGPRVAKQPTTEADHERLRLAAEKRARKAARQAKGIS